jgi:hypothetical protein
MSKLFLTGLVILGILFLGLAYVYWTTPAHSLPHYLPGFEADSSKIHFKHGLGSLILGLGAFTLAWFQSGKKSLN